MRGRGRGYHKTFTLQVRKDDDEDIARSGHKKIFVNKFPPSSLKSLERKLSFRCAAG